MLGGGLGATVEPWGEMDDPCLLMAPVIADWRRGETPERKTRGWK